MKTWIRHHHVARIDEVNACCYLSHGEFCFERPPFAFDKFVFSSKRLEVGGVCLSMSERLEVSTAGTPSTPRVAGIVLLARAVSHWFHVLGSHDVGFFAP